VSFIHGQGKDAVRCGQARCERWRPAAARWRSARQTRDTILLAATVAALVLMVAALVWQRLCSSHHGSRM
jgi:hypothetical protein